MSRTQWMIPIKMSSHSLPDIFKIGEYQLDKKNFILTHKNQRKNSTGRKRRIEYFCDDCNELFITKLRDELKSQFPWLCRSCTSKKLWKDVTYRNSILAGVTNETREFRRNQRKEISLKMWADSDKRTEISKKLRNRDASMYSRARKAMRTSTILKHWKTQEELVCVGSYETAFINWCNVNNIDFDWQIPHKMPDERTYIVDAFIKTGEFANTWIEIKGYMTDVGREKWEWFHEQFLFSSQLWEQQTLRKLGILK